MVKQAILWFGAGEGAEGCYVGNFADGCQVDRNLGGEPHRDRCDLFGHLRLALCQGWWAWPEWRVPVGL